MSGKSDDGSREGRQQNGDPPRGQQPQDEPPDGRPQRQSPQGQQPPDGQRPPRRRPPGRQPQHGGNEAEVTAAKAGILLFSVVGFGYFVLRTLVGFLGDESGQLLSGVGSDQLFVATTATIGAIETVIPVLAVGLAVYYHSTGTREPLPKITAIASTAGVVSVIFVLLLLALAFEPSGLSVDLGAELTGFVGLTLGTAVIAAGAAFLLDEDPLEVF